jgi:hypothetical protein
MAKQELTEMERYPSVALLANSYRIVSRARAIVRLFFLLLAVAEILLHQPVFAGFVAAMWVALEVWIHAKTRSAGQSARGIDSEANKRGLQKMVGRLIKRAQLESTIGVAATSLLEEIMVQSQRCSRVVFEMEFERRLAGKKSDPAKQELSAAMGETVNQTLLLLEPSLTTGGLPSPTVLNRIESYALDAKLIAEEAVRWRAGEPLPEDQSIEDLLTRLRAMRELEGAELTELTSKIPLAAPGPWDPTESVRYSNLARMLGAIRRRDRFITIRQTFSVSYLFFLAVTMLAAWYVHNTVIYCLILITAVLVPNYVMKKFGKGPDARAMTDVLRRGGSRGVEKLLIANKLDDTMGEETAARLESCAAAAQAAIGAAAELTLLSNAPKGAYTKLQKEIVSSAKRQFEDCVGSLWTTAAFKMKPEADTMRLLERTQARLQALTAEVQSLSAAVTRSDPAQTNAIIERLRSMREIEAAEGDSAQSQEGST